MSAYLREMVRLYASIYTTPRVLLGQFAIIEAAGKFHLFKTDGD